MNFFKRAAQALSGGFQFGSAGGGYGANDPWGGLWRMLSGSTFDYRREAGIPWENSIVMGGLSWAMRNFPRARLAYQRPNGRLLENGQPAYDELPDHPFIALCNRPNPFYSRGTLLKGLILSRMVDANAFVFIERTALELPQALYYVPHFMVSPRWYARRENKPPTFPGQSTPYLDHWEYRVDGESVPWEPLNVFHWRDGIDPQNQRRGLSPLTSVLREIAADNCASTMAASLLRNNNVPGMIISPKTSKTGDSFQNLTDTQEDKIRAMAQQKFRGDRAGELMIVPTAVSVDRLGFSPADMNLTELRKINVERVLAQWGIPMAVAGMAAGVEQTKVGATMKSLIELAWDQCLIPMQDEFAEELTFWASREFAAWYEPGDRVIFDRSQVSALQGDVTELHARVCADYQAGLIKRSEGRRIFGMAPGAEDDIYFGQTPPVDNEAVPLAETNNE